MRSLKAVKVEKAKVDEAVKGLLELKAKYKAATGQVSESSGPHNYVIFRVKSQDRQPIGS